MSRLSLLRILFTLFILFTGIAGSTQQIAFPGAEGFGRFTTGGRGQSVYYVTNLNDAGAGSLRDALSVGNRTILFKVSGTIFLNSSLSITKDNTTIAGQSAPGDGICLANYTFRVDASNVIVRFIRCRLGDLKKYADDGMDGNGTSPIVTRSNIIIDHCSMGWSLDEAGSFYDNKNFTMQWCMVTESLYHSYHPKGDHGYGGIWGGQGASFHHNLLAHHTSRNPRFCGSRYTGDSINEIVDFRNNVIYNWGNTNSAYGGEGGNYNMINNYYKPGPATPKSSLRYRILNYTTYYFATDAKIYPDTVWGGKFYVNGNFVNGYSKTTADNWLGQGSNPGVQIDNSAFKAVMARGKLLLPLTVAPVTTNTPQDAFNLVVAYAGATMPARDTIDRRIAKDAITGTATFGGHTYDSAYTNNAPSGIIDTQSDVGSWPTLNSLAAPSDVDIDGMADEWETQRGLNPANASDRNSFNINGYTNLENYLNGDSIIASGVYNTVVYTRTVNLSGSSKWIDLKDTTYTRLISTDTTNLVASIMDSAITPGNISAAYMTFKTPQLNSHGKPYLSRMITLNAANISAGYFKLRLYITKAELDNLKINDPTVKSVSDLLVIQDSSDIADINSVHTAYTPVSTGLWGTYKTGYYLDIITNKVGNFYFESAAAATLPLNLISFKATRNGKAANILWSTDNEINLDKFIVEKSSDANKFDYLTTIIAANNTGTHHYAITDAPVANGTSYYRLKMIDKSGGFSYSTVVSITDNGSEIKVFPDPAKESIDIFHGRLNKATVIKIFSAQGQQVMEANTIAGSGQTKVNITALSKGVYFISLADNPVQKIMFIKE